MPVGMSGRLKKVCADITRVFFSSHLLYMHGLRVILKMDKAYSVRNMLIQSFCTYSRAKV